MLKTRRAINEEFIKKMYDDIADDFNEHRMSAPNQWDLVEYPEVKKLIGHFTNKVILDAGCGPGMFINRLIRSGPKKVVGIDLSSRMIEIARAKYGHCHNVQLLQGSISKITFPDKYFDLIVSFDVLQDVKNIKQTFSEFFRVLKNNKSIIFSIRNPVRNLSYMAQKGKVDYFKSGWYEEQWPGTGSRTVYSYHRPLSDWINTLTEVGFMIKMMVEPKPGIKVKIKYPEFYHKYMRIPRGLIFIAEKDSESR